MLAKWLGEQKIRWLDRRIERLMAKIRKLKIKQRRFSLLRDQRVAGTVPESKLQLFVSGIRTGEVFGRRKENV